MRSWIIFLEVSFWLRSLSSFEEELMGSFRSFERRGGTNRADFWR